MDLITRFSSFNLTKSIERRRHKLHTTLLLKSLEKNIPSREFLEILLVPDLVKKAKKFQSRNGYFPASFGVMNSFTPAPKTYKKNFISPIIPGNPYSFNEPSDYYQTYAESWWGITHKKGGWDCMRHLEIIDSGALPLMYDAKSIPEGAMFYYPKDLLRRLYEEFKKNPFIADEKLLEYFAKWKQEYLTCEALIRNSLLAADINTSQEKILFIDPALDESPDYLSLMVLYGLERLFPGKVDIFSKSPDYIFDDYQLNTDSLYGKGFGYTKGIPSILRNVVDESNCDWNSYSTIFVGQGLRNIPLIELIPPNLLHEKLVVFEGSDDPIGKVDLNKLLSYSRNLFVREGHR